MKHIPYMDISELPQDDAILMSYLNTKLRDVYASLDDLCHDMHIDKDEITQRMAKAGFEYSEQYNKFW